MPTDAITHLGFPQDDIAVLTLDDPNKGANILARSVLDEFETHFDTLDARDNVAGLVIRSGKPGMFIAGADIREFLQWIDAPAEEVSEFGRRGQSLFRRLATCDYVTVAAIDGVCVGGGAELSLWCDRRVFSNSPKTAYGFPEVKLGIFPGWGGTARLPRVIGLSNAIEMTTGGESIGVEEAAANGLANDVVPADDLTEAAIRMIRSGQSSGDYLRDRERWAGPIEMSETELGFLGATASAMIQQKTKGKYPAPIAALELMLRSIGVDVGAACEMEAVEFAKLFGTPVSRSLINVFFLSDRNKKDKGIDSGTPTATPTPSPSPEDGGGGFGKGSPSAEAEGGIGIAIKKIGSVSVIGAGIMGQGIAAANVKRRVTVSLGDANADALARGVQQILEEVSYNKKTKAADVERAVEYAAFINGTVSDAELCASDLVVEAIIENLDIKKELFARIEPQLRDDAILCSNTSTISITHMAEGLSRPERFCGLHFFNPVRRMPLVEVIRGEKTSDETVATCVAYAKKLGKSPIVVGDEPGFLVNRLLLPYMNESLQLVIEGASLRQVDKASTAFGMPIGPIALLDVVGLDTAVHAGRVMYEAFPDRIQPSELLTALFKANRLGQKNGKGFFTYSGKKKRGVDDPVVEKMIAERVREPKSFTQDELIDRLFLPMVLEATRVLKANLVRDVRDVDLGLIYGIGFPPFRGGLLFWADTIGAEAVIERLKPFIELGKRYEPTEMLKEMAASRGKFYPS